MDAIESMKHKLCGACRQLLVTKSAAVIIGFIVKTAIVLTATNLILGDAIKFKSESSNIDEGPSASKGTSIADITMQRTYRFLLAVCVFLFLLFSSAILARYTAKMKHVPQRMRDMYAGGLALIPAWGFKDVVSAFIILFTKTSSTLDVTQEVPDGVPVMDGVVAVLVAAGCSVLQIALDSATANMQHEEGLLIQVMSSLKSSMGLGVGFAVNHFVHAVIGGKWTNVYLELGYVLVLSVALPTLQIQLRSLCDECKADVPALNANRWGGKTISFMALSLQFVLGWAWKALIDHGVAPYLGGDSALHAQLVVSITVTMLFISVDLLFTLREVGKEIMAMCALVAGMNIGWAWMDFAAVCVTSAIGPGSCPLPFLWLFCIGVVLCVFLVASGLDIAIRAIERSEEMTDLVKEDIPRSKA